MIEEIWCPWWLGWWVCCWNLSWRLWIKTFWNCPNCTSVRTVWHFSPHSIQSGDCGDIGVTNLVMMWRKRGSGGEVRGVGCGVSPSSMCSRYTAHSNVQPRYNRLMGRTLPRGMEHIREETVQRTDTVNRNIKYAWTMYNFLELDCQIFGGCNWGYFGPTWIYSWRATG